MVIHLQDYKRWVNYNTMSRFRVPQRWFLIVHKSSRIVLVVLVMEEVVVVVKFTSGGKVFIINLTEH